MSLRNGLVPMVGKNIGDNWLEPTESNEPETKEVQTEVDGPVLGSLERKIFYPSTFPNSVLGSAENGNLRNAVTSIDRSMSGMLISFVMLQCYRMSVVSGDTQN